MWLKHIKRYENYVYLRKLFRSESGTKQNMWESMLRWYGIT